MGSKTILIRINSPHFDANGKTRFRERRVRVAVIRRRCGYAIHRPFYLDKNDPRAKGDRFMVTHIASGRGLGDPRTLVDAERVLGIFAERFPNIALTKFRRLADPWRQWCIRVGLGLSFAGKQPTVAPTFTKPAAKAKR